MIMSYYDPFSISFQCDVTVSVSTTNQEVLFGVEKKNWAAAFYSIPGFITGLKIPVILIIQTVTFNMNQKFSEIILNSFIFVMDIFCTNFTRKYQ